MVMPFFDTICTYSLNESKSAMTPDMNELIIAYALVIVVILAISAVIWIIIKISQWIIFQKAGYAGWKSLIPIYDTFVLLHIIQRPQWWGFLLIGTSILQLLITSNSNPEQAESLIMQFLSGTITLIAFFYSVRMTHGLSKAFGRGVGFTFGLLFLPVIFYPMLALGSARYQYTQ